MKYREVRDLDGFWVDILLQSPLFRVIFTIATQWASLFYIERVWICKRCEFLFNCSRPIWIIKFDNSDDSLLSILRILPYQTGIKVISEWLQ